MTGRKTTFVCRPGADLDNTDIDLLAAFIETHGGVPPGRVRHNLERAFLIAWAEQGAIVGTSCLKHPRPDYLKNLSERTGLNLEGFLERGYTCVHPRQTGLGIAGRLIDLLRTRAGDRPCYALVQEHNPAIQEILSHGPEVKVMTFYSERAGKDLGLWISPAGLEKLRCEM